MIQNVTSIWIADLRISFKTANKLRNEHGLDVEEVRQALVCVSGLSFSWDDDSERGERALILIKIREKAVLAVLYPRLNDAYGDSWNLGSAYPINR
jgi:uncharacterized DUF497 family protein